MEVEQTQNTAEHSKKDSLISHKELKLLMGTERKVAFTHRLKSNQTDPGALRSLTAQIQARG